ncbi:hypothetical protein K3495_g15306, partial [Podosphaera aphanis]
VYSPERGYTILSSRVVIKESEKGGTVDLRIRNSKSGPQGTMNVTMDRKPRGRPRNIEIAQVQSNPHLSINENKVRDENPDLEEQERQAKESSMALATGKNLVLSDDTVNQGQKQAVTTSQHPLPTSTDKEIDTENDDKDESNLESFLNGDDSSYQETEKPPSSSVKIDHLENLDKDYKENDEMIDIFQHPSDLEAEKKNSTIEKTRPRYFTRSTIQKRPVEEDLDSHRISKRVRALIAQILFDDNKYTRLLSNQQVSQNFETALPAQVIAGIKIPCSYNEAIRDPNHSEMWKNAINEELVSLRKNETFIEAIPPSNANLVSCKWVFTIKTHTDGSIERFKARLVARGFSQVYGQDYHQTFAPTVRMDTLRLFLAVVAAENLECSHYDIKNAFTESHLKEEIFLEPPKGIQIKKGYVWKALRSLYGLKQAARDWNCLIKKYLLALGFIQSCADPCMFTHEKNDVKLLVYVDDIVASARCLAPRIWGR